MKLISLVFATSILAGTTTAWGFFPITLGPVWIPLRPVPVVSTCTAAISYRPLGSFLFGSLFPNPWAGFGGSLTIPNCNAPPAPTPACPSGQSCLSSTPLCATGTSCLAPPPAPRFPGQPAANAVCAASAPGLGLVACLSSTGVAVNCCAP